ncbi:MAG TPA: di-heme-cytochrome C peroxidase [Xanthomonadales bacterium]|nr:di-heme-cytochrome C peroxidase [Xanthomonadales bacterium]
MAAIAVVALAGCSEKPAPAPISEGDAVPGAPGVVNLAQGWSDEEQDKAWFTSFGSRLLPYSWLLHLERAGSTERFMSNAHMRELGFLVQEQPTAHNPDALPVGFTREKGGDGQDWAGLGCAACHTGEIHHGTTRIRVDGGQALIDFDRFEGELVEALSAVPSDPARLERLAKAVGATDTLALSNQVVALAQKLDARHRGNHSDVPYGHGRLDAFGQIFNAVTVDFLGIPGNVHVPDAPVSYPAMWTASHLDLVQWNASAPNAGPGPLFQNVTTALAVYGELDLADKGGIDGYGSSANFANLGHIQEWMYELKSPPWPQTMLGALDAERVARGSAIYARECVSCHALVDRNDPKRIAKAVLTPLDEVGTDPRMATNFLTAKAQSGQFAGKKQAVLAGDPLGAEARAIDLVIHAAMGAVLRHPLKSVRDSMQSHHKVVKAAIDANPNYYKARPLDGVWATAPYLHNGSVPSLAELLKAPADRVAKFWVGTPDFDVDAVGLVATEGDGRSLFDTSLVGNSNAGHAFGTTLADGDKRDLLEYLKSL